MRSFRFNRDHRLKKTIVLSAALVVFGSPFASVAQPKPVPHPHFPTPGAPKLPRPPKAKQDTDMVQVQQALKEKGYDPGPVDGILGPSTKAALRAFQKSGGLEPSGQLDRGTVEKLGVHFTQFTSKEPIRKAPPPAQPK